ncbi:hypothetical protein [Streptomyces sp. NPDC004267]|uniref:hypothetical protein n=1 Tax=Streptomyces sp. NPDC004267 TaxID=3364694 RepID=UPI0036A47371
MRTTITRRVGTAATVAALTASVLGLGAGSASADQYVRLSTTHNVGLYTSPNTWNGKVIESALTAGRDGVLADCWTRGQDINSNGNVWYHITYAYWNVPGAFPYATSAYVYGAYVDNNATFHSGVLPPC